jgi:hypothetical protein
MSPRETLKREVRLDQLALRGSIIGMARRRGIVARLLVRLLGLR